MKNIQKECLIINQIKQMKKKVLLFTSLMIGFLSLKAQHSDIVVKSESIFSTPTNGLSYHNFRIPAFLVTKDKTFLALAEGREGHNTDHAENDIVLRRSLDQGKTWLPAQIIVHDNKNCTMNPVIVEGNDGRIILTYLWFPHKYHSRNIPKDGVKMCETGFTGDKITRNFVIYSDDQGVSWSKPLDVTNVFKLSENTIMAMPGPGNAICIQKGKYKGRIVIPMCDAAKTTDGNNFIVYSTWSDDNGLTWKAGERAVPTDAGVGGNEVQIVEISNNTLLLNTRTSKAVGCRALAYSYDGGNTWSKLKLEPKLPDTGCMGSIINYKDGGNRALLAVTSTTRLEKGRRGKAILFKSLDEGKTWSQVDVLYSKTFDYSSLQQLPNGNIGMLGEYDFNGERINIKLSELDINKILY